MLPDWCDTQFGSVWSRRSEHLRVRIGELFVDRFEIVAPAGEGGMGLVFRARDRSNGRDVALKLLRDPDGEQLERFRQEAELLTLLDHPVIVRCLDHGHAPNGDAFLVLEWLAGETLGK